ncbi:MBL fold metallo-hydrolase [Pueribacillus theae]|uniref:MBL fold metallo-hydrolase n=1 Tax=Pueribacillus theae TaxID=2171751 RepID=A0A2U1K4M5_9BACI|nr:MBL fold metallo-hydrolase [Pueribacillus theae]PWA11943.1 MBL fold metallo-hydrolase [Pueribacillus theae]
MISTNKYEVFPVIAPVEFSLKTVNFYLVKDDHSLTLIDAGYNDEDCWQALQKTLKENDCKLSDLTQIILTHHHIDHVGLINRITEIHPIPVYCHPLSIPRLKREPRFMEMRVDFYTKLYEEMGCGEAGKKQIHYLQKALTKNKSQAIECDLSEITAEKFMGFEVIETPGHAPDQLAFYDRKQKWLFSGDLLIEHISSNALVEPDPFGIRMNTLTDHYNSMEKFLSFEIDTIFPGHGTLIKNHHELITKRLNGIERKAEKFLALIKNGFTTGSEIAHEYYKETYEKQFSLVMSEVVGHLDYLETNGKVEKKKTNGIWHYTVVE